MKAFITLLLGLTLSSFACLAQDVAAITWFEPVSANTGDQVVISLRHFGSGDSTQVLFNGIRAKLIKFSTDHLVVQVPPGNTSGIITVSGPGISLTSRQAFVHTGAIAPALAARHPVVAPAAGKATVSSPAPSAKPTRMVAASVPVVPVPSPKADSSQAPVISAKTVPETEKGKLPKIKSEGKPLILSFSPKTGPSGTLIHISGLNFGFEKGAVSVSIRNTNLPVQSVYDQEIIVAIPNKFKDSGTLVVTVDGKKGSSKDQFKNN